MPRGPNGEKRPADAIGLAVMVGRIATGEEVDATLASKNRRKSGIAGAEARMKNTSVAQRSQIATLAASARWKKEEATMNADHNACDTVAAIYRAKEGLLDVKFLFQNRTEASLFEACKELATINEAIRDGKATDLDFGDLDWH